jgi:hypothetical protein
MLEGTFDTTVALSGLYLWMLFGYLATMMNCDLQRFIKTNVFFRHAIAIVAFFFLFTLVDVDSKSHIGIIWLKTLFVYVLYIMAIKSKWYFAFPVLALLMIDQTLKMHVKYLEKKEKMEDYILEYNDIRKNINNAIIVIIIVGFIYYILRQYSKYGEKFSFYKLVTSEECSMK